MPVTKRDYADAVMVQDACNASGVILSMAQMMARLVNAMPELGGTAERNRWLLRHPVMALYLSKVIDLAGGVDKLNEVYGPCLALCKTSMERGEPTCLICHNTPANPPREDEPGHCPTCGAYRWTI